MKIYCSLFILCYSLSGIAQDLKTINTQMADALVHKDVKTLMRYYAEDAVYMPEHSKTLFRKNDIRRYYEQRFSTTSINDFKKQIFRTEVIKNYLIETGTFTSTIIKEGKAPYPYNGKYLNVWKTNEQGHLQLVSEIWGGTGYPERANLYEPGGTWMPKLKKDDLTKEVIARNGLITHAVVNRNAVEQSNYFMEDALYMPYYDTLYIGRKKIEHYFSAHYNPNVAFDTLMISTSKIINLDDVVIEYGYYYIVWNDSKNNGAITGKSTNIWRRNEKGDLMMYWQMVNHD